MYLSDRSLPSPGLCLLTCPFGLINWKAEAPQITLKIKLKDNVNHFLNEKKR